VDITKKLFTHKEAHKELGCRYVDLREENLCV